MLSTDPPGDRGRDGGWAPDRRSTRPGRNGSTEGGSSRQRQPLADVKYISPAKRSASSAALTVAAGAHPKLLQAQLGHASINVTLNTYGHLFPDAFTDVGDALDRLVRGSNGADVASRQRTRESA
jgi:hypothetical protein